LTEGHCITAWERLPSYWGYGWTHSV